MKKPDHSSVNENVTRGQVKGIHQSTIKGSIFKADSHPASPADATLVATLPRLRDTLPQPRRNDRWNVAPDSPSVPPFSHKGVRNIDPI